jgi:hypothetical protein
MLTTTGMVFLAMAANDGGRVVSNAARFAALEIGTIASDENTPKPKPHLKPDQSDLRVAQFIRPFTFPALVSTLIH